MPKPTRPRPKNQTHCRRGHLLTNTTAYWTPKGRLRCVLCRKERAAARRKAREAGIELPGELDLDEEDNA